MSVGVIADSYVAGGGGGGAVSPYSYTNTTSPTGLITVVSAGTAAETTVPGMDATGLTANAAVDFTINLWEAMNQPGQVKGCIARLRDGGPTGTVLASHQFTDAGDSTAGHQQQWSFSGTVVPATGRLTVTIQATGGGAPQITSDTRTFNLTQPATGTPVAALSNAFTAAVLADAPIAFWTCEATGEYAFRDLTGNKHQLLPSSAGVTRGQAGPNANLPGGVLLDGSSGTLITDVPLNNSDLTIEVWLKTTDGSGGLASTRVAGGRSVTLSVGTNPVSGGVAGGPDFYVDDAGIGIGAYTTTKTVHDNVWHQVAGVWDGTSGAAVTASQFKVVVDGADVTSGTFSAGGINAPLTSGAVAYVIGQSGNGYLNGTIAAIAIYATPLTIARLAAHQAALTS